MRKPEYDENRKMWVVFLDSYENSLLFYDAKTAWDFYTKSLASGKTDEELLSE
ncbi:MAG: hypothetical protein LBD41_07840 [Clostridiales Family XIII bacterium]|jgi:hypothetical protein|nr:hypothetical protein [Clostridiales Family XIII bacterium]